MYRTYVYAESFHRMKLFIFILIIFKKVEATPNSAKKSKKMNKVVRKEIWKKGKEKFMYVLFIKGLLKMYSIEEVCFMVINLLKMELFQPLKGSEVL